MIAFFLSVLESDEDKQKLAEIYEQCHEQVEQTTMRILKNQHDAEDAVQNTFMQVIRHFNKVYELPFEKLPYWIIAIAKNEALMILRKKKKIVHLEDWDTFALEDEHISGYEELVQLFSKLPETYRAVLEMKILLDYSGKEIAQHLGISETAVNTRISRGRTLLRKIIEKEGYIYDGSES